MLPKRLSPSSYFYYSMKRAFPIYLSVLALCACAGQQQWDMADKNVTQETKALYSNMIGMQGESVMFGHQDDTSYGIGWMDDSGQSDVRSVAGDYPAVYGWDMGHIETGSKSNIDKVPFAQMREHMIQAFERGGVNTLSWHLQNPLTGGSSWDVSSNGVVSSILPNGEKHGLFIQWLDALADFIASLKTADGTAVPILFRPYHEHTGSWFWWGKTLCSKEDYISLWHFTVHYLRDTKNLHNILYVYSPDFVEDEQAYFDRYPGDEYVDVLGLDFYHRDGEAKAQEYIANVQRILEMLHNSTMRKGKPYVFSETGSEGIPISDWFTRVLYKAIEPYKPVYVLLWRNAFDIPGHFYAPYPGHPSEDDFIQFKNMPDIFFQTELPDMYIDNKELL